MKILYLGNNRLGADLLAWLVAQGADVVGLVLHPEVRRKEGPALLRAAGLAEDRVFRADQLGDEAVRDRIAALAPDLGVSVLFGYILRKPFLDLFPQGVVNLHPSYLPYNRGAYPNVWSIIDGTPAGVTLHYIDEGVDTGGLIAQRRVPVEPVDTGARLYEKLEAAARALFEETWPRLRDGAVRPVPQSAGEGTAHRVADVAAVDHIDLDATYTARDLIDLIRARTFPPYDGAYFVTEDGERVYLRLELYRKEEHAR